MRHNNKKNKLNAGSSSHLKAMMRNLATSVILHERVKTTAKKAKIVTPIVEGLITTVKKKDTVNAIREINKVVYDVNASKKLVEVLKDRYKDRESGFTRTTKFKNRDGDNAQLVVLELVA